MNKIIKIERLGFPWATQDPFLFCVHHHDQYPKGTDTLGPEPSELRGRNIGSDFAGKNGWSMYHGSNIPGFPHHPHRGFETVTIAKQGVIDHADSMGAAGRFRGGDVQWMTAGKGVLHSEMFPLLNKDSENPLEMFQIWLNLPRADKFVEPHFKMLWAEEVPKVTVTDAEQRKIVIDLIAGTFGEHKALDPTPDSWAAKSENAVAIWTIKMDANATFNLPRAAEGLNRTLYFYKGDPIEIEGQKVSNGNAIQLVSGAEIEIKAGETEAFFLLLEGRPINEPVAQHGPFVMNTRAEIQAAFADYQRTQFGGWKWGTNGPVHDTPHRRFAKYADGTLEVKS